MIPQIFKKAVFITSMLIIIGLSGCKKNAGEDYQPPVASPPISSPPVNTGWTALVLPQGEFFVGPGLIGWFNGDNFLLGIKNDLFAISRKGSVWRYNVTGDWSRVGSFPEDMPELPVTFSVNGMGYCIGKSHCWQFNPATSQWTRKNDPPAWLSAPLVVGNKAYLRTFFSNHFFAYDPATDAYTQQKDPPDFGNYLLGYFVINEQGYYVGASGECWKYDASLDHWQSQASLTAVDTVPESPAISFSLNNGGYILEDVDNDPQLSLWRYDADLNQWEKKDYYPGYGTQRVKAASLDSFACIGLGMTGDFWDAELWMYK
jgi:hypothetical protein